LYDVYVYMTYRYTSVYIFINKYIRALTLHRDIYFYFYIRTFIFHSAIYV